MYFSQRISELSLAVENGANVQSDHSLRQQCTEGTVVKFGRELRTKLVINVSEKISIRRTLHDASPVSW